MPRSRQAGAHPVATAQHKVGVQSLKAWHRQEMSRGVDQVARFLQGVLFCSQLITNYGYFLSIRADLRLKHPKHDSGEAIST